MYYDIEFRIVRIRLDNGTYICIATNLSGEEFPLEEINKLYRMRWSEKTSFRELKYTIAVNICKAYLKHGGNETETMLLILIPRYLLITLYMKIVHLQFVHIELK